MSIARIDAVSLHATLRDGEEVALIDPREEGIFGDAHLLLAVNVPLSRLEVRIERLVPRKSTRIVLVDDDDGLAERAASRLGELGYCRIAILDGGITAWRTAGFELFSGMSVPTKAFGEWIAVMCRTPLITPEELQGKLAAGEDVVILDSRPANEYANMTIPGAINVPVSELVYRFGELPVNPGTLVVVNCAGRTRSLIGAQTLIDAGIANRVVALRGGTMAWQMAGFDLEHGATRHAPEPWGTHLQDALARARMVAERHKAHIIDRAMLAAFKAEQDSRSLYIIDVRTPDEFRAGHRADSTHAWGVQLVQSIDRYVATRNARLVLIDNFQVRGLMTASWLVQAGWTETFVLAEPFRGVELESGEPPPVPAGLLGSPLPRIGAVELRGYLDAGKATVVDFSDSLSYRRGHIPGGWFAIRSRLAECLTCFPHDGILVASGNDETVTALAASDLTALSGRPVLILDGGNEGWARAGFSLATGFEKLATSPDDVFRMPFLWGHYEDKAEFEAAANAYFAWELHLPEQIARSGEISFSR